MLDKKIESAEVYAKEINKLGAKKYLVEKMLLKNLRPRI